MARSPKPKTPEAQNAKPLARQTADLGRLSVENRLDEIARALPLVLTSAQELDDAAGMLGEEQARAAAVLRLHADEEAAKGLMLLDLARCPQPKKVERERLAEQISHHLPRLICAETTHWCCADWAEVTRAVEGLRPEFYLDGPTGADWVFANSLIERREAILYVDRYRWESGTEWRAPEGFWLPYQHSAPTEFLKSLGAVGAFQRDALQIIADSWADLDLQPDTQWQEIADRNLATLKAFEKHGWLRDATQEEIERSLRWPWPLYDLDLATSPVDLDGLVSERARQAGRVGF